MVITDARGQANHSSGSSIVNPRVWLKSTPVRGVRVDRTLQPKGHGQSLKNKVRILIRVPERTHAKACFEVECVAV